MNYDNEKTGALFKNDKQGNEKRPDYRGTCEIERKQYFVSAWIRTSKAGEKFMSLRFEPKMARDHKGGASNPDRPIPEPVREEFNDDIPF